MVKGLVSLTKGMGVESLVDGGILGLG